MLQTYIHQYRCHCKGKVLRNLDLLSSAALFTSSKIQVNRSRAPQCKNISWVSSSTLQKHPVVVRRLVVFSDFSSQLGHWEFSLWLSGSLRRFCSLMSGLYLSFLLLKWRFQNFGQRSSLRWSVGTWARHSSVERVYFLLRADSSVDQSGVMCDLVWWNSLLQYEVRSPVDHHILYIQRFHRGGPEPMESQHMCTWRSWISPWLLLTVPV